jgi:ion channel-forming bestrophin family protein
MIQREKLQWLRLAFQLKGSVIPSISKRVIGCGLFGVLVSIAYALKLPVSQPILGTVIPSIVLGLLLVLRTNTAYERFWEGRKCWGSIIINSNNLARQILVSVAELEPGDRKKKFSVLRLLVAFAVATKLQLRGEAVNVELEDLISSYQYSKLKTMNNPPLEIAFWISAYLQQQANRKALDPYNLPLLQQLLNNMVEGLIACQRILTTPMPLAYAIHLKQLLLLYCLLIPFQFVQEMGFWTGPIVALISFTLFGIEAIGIEIENPFGYDANDLPLDGICATMKRNIEDLISLTPGSEGDAAESIGKK